MNILSWVVPVTSGSCSGCLWEDTDTVELGGASRDSAGCGIIQEGLISSSIGSISGIRTKKSSFTGSLTRYSIPKQLIREALGGSCHLVHQQSCLLADLALVARIFIPKSERVGLIQINLKYTNLFKFTKVTNSDLFFQRVLLILGWLKHHSSEDQIDIIV